MSLNGIPRRQSLKSGKAAVLPCCRPWIFGLLLCALTALRCAGALQFDVFIGYDGLVPEACWFPIVCEVKNDGPSFTATVEVKGGYAPDQSLLMPVELPTGTLKRFVIPVFAGGSGYATWDLRLLDE